ncbi:hypothetical protein GVN16_16685 [Emticicia sp. CRIBPO]|uniref:hypothetical protein n=1 Tax=Emticicia sp. CRIBPO TaxID=2683258 RepID=UPI001412BC66|nr:hypothetical protein [Emticicia sp. CRIBPO]NBA87413.1 hypothetical protein [Emticicia sp. CRIBPO]
MKNIILLLLILFCVTSCWAPRCPMKTCRVKQEHFHEDQVSGVFMGRGLYPPRIHYLWDKDKGEANPDTEFQPSTGVKRKKLRKKFPWERW